jgi:hypothetical protein
LGTKADSGNHFGLDDWGERGRPACGFGRRARTIVGQISLLDGFSAGRRKRRPGRSRSPFPNAALERLFSWIHFGLDERGKGRLNNVGSDALFMSVQPFHGKTFVAFMDIEGFKSMMGDGKRAPLALDAFYSAGYTVLKEHRGDAILVDGFFMSDCGVLFVRGENEASSIRLESICRIIQQIHQRTFKKTFQLTTSISWGDFSYDERIEFPGIEKNPIYGSAYVAAFVDSKAHPKLYSSECRLKRDELLPPDIIDWCISKQGAVAERMRETPRHFYYDWMRE